ncbi:hypothetical protein D3C73_1053320 [compost metagenome]
MKKFVSGVIVGVMLFAGASAFAASPSLIGQKVQGLFTIERNGNKIADAVIINGSAYAPVRSVAEATGAGLSVEGKKIIMSTENIITQNSAKIQELQVQKELILKSIQAAQGGINLYDTDIIPRAEEYAKNTVGTPREEQYAKWLSDRRSEREQYVVDLASYKEKLNELEAQIAELQK